VIGGVCAALAEALRIPAWMLRVLFCFLLLGWGAGLLLYLVLMICIPDSRKTASRR
jgi:phage shock protein PspC (stress-responsive transcriptional regulator)